MNTEIFQRFYYRLLLPLCRMPLWTRTLALSLIVSSLYTIHSVQYTSDHASFDWNSSARRLNDIRDSNDVWCLFIYIACLCKDNQNIDFAFIVFHFGCNPLKISVNSMENTTITMLRIQLRRNTHLQYSVKL